MPAMIPVGEGVFFFEVYKQLIRSSALLMSSAQVSGFALALCPTLLSDRENEKGV